MAKHVQAYDIAILILAALLIKRNNCLCSFFHVVRLTFGFDNWSLIQVSFSQITQHLFIALKCPQIFIIWHNIQNNQYCTKSSYNIQSNHFILCIYASHVCIQAERTIRGKLSNNTAWQKISESRLLLKPTFVIVSVPLVRVFSQDKQTDFVPF